MKLNFYLKFIIPLVLITCCYMHVDAQDEPGNVTNTYALENVTVVTRPGDSIANATLVIKDGLIKSVGRNVIIPSNARMIKADSMYVYAGFIDGLSHIGVPMPKNEEQAKAKDPGNPSNERAGVTPERTVGDYLNPTDKSIAAFRKAGFTAVHAVPRGRMLPGSGAVILLDGKKSTDLIFRDNVGTYSQLKGAGGVFPNTVIAVMTKWRELYRQAQQASTHITKYKSSSSGMKRPSYDDATEAMIPVTKRRSKVYMYVEDHLSIHRALQLQKDLGFDMTLAGLQNGWRLADKIRSKNIPVLLSLELPKEPKKDKKDKEEITDQERKTLVQRQNKEIEGRVSQASAFAKKGIKFGFTSEGVVAKDVKGSLIRMIKAGLSKKDALAAITTNPASILGIQREMGTVETGKIANLVVTNKPYFNEKSAIRYVFVDGNLHEYEPAKAGKKGSTNSKEDLAKALGTWAYLIDAGEMQITGTLEIEEVNGSLSGTMEGEQIETPVATDIELNDNEISYEVTIDDTTVSFNGNIDDDTLSGKINIEGQGSFPLTATRTSTPD